MTKKRKRRIEMIKSIQPTSITSLKMQCFIAADGKIDEAKKIYDYFSEGMENLPISDPVPPKFIDNAKTTINGTIGWIRENQDTLAQVVEFVRGILTKKGVSPSSPATPLPPIN